MPSWGISPELGGRAIFGLGKWRPARSFAWMVVMIFVIVLSFGPATEALTHVLPNDPAFQFLAKASGALIGLVVRCGTHRQPRRDAFDHSLRRDRSRRHARLLLRTDRQAVVVDRRT